MEKKLQQRLDMIQATCTFLDNHRDIWNENMRIGSVLDALKATTADIARAHTEFHRGKTQGYTKEVYARLDDAIGAVLRLTNIVTESALARKDKVLLERVKCEHSDITRLRQAEGIEKLNSLYAICLSEAPGITGSTLTDEDFRAARTGIDAYVGLRGLKRQVGDARKAERQNIVRLFDATVPILKQLDLLLRNYERSNPVFYQQYQHARKTLLSGGRKQARFSKPKKDGTSAQPPIDLPKPVDPPTDTPDAGASDAAGQEGSVA